MPANQLQELDLPQGIRTRLVENHNGLSMHVLDAGYETPGRPALLLLHGFPELAYSWRKTMLPLAAAGYHVIAPDQRGYGRTTGWDGDYDGDLASFRTHNMARDALGLIIPPANPDRGRPRAESP
jgi:pimeloyl-ACP methyl ester carboxylesterase